MNNYYGEIKTMNNYYGDYSDDEFPASWEEAMSEARLELGYSEDEFVSDWDGLIEVAHEYHDIIKKENYDAFCDNARTKYHKYLESDEWKTLRAMILTRDNNTCLDCGKAAEQIHHLDYSFLHTEKEKDFCISLCRKCHEIRHDISTIKTIRRKETTIKEDEEKVGYWMDK